MTSDKSSKSLWGQDFRLVAEGLAETDVVIFVERLMREHRQSLDQLDHISSLHELAKKTVEDAERIAAGIVDEAREKAKAEAEGIVAEGRQRVDEVIEAAERDADALSEVAREQSIAIEVEFKKLATERFARVDAALRDLVEAAKAELATRMPTHYLGKHLYASVHFIPAFEKLVKEAERELDLDLAALSATVKAADQESSNGPAAGPSGNGSGQFQTSEEPPEYD